MKTYTELMKLKTFRERFLYLKLDGKVGFDTFGYDRIFNQMFYRNQSEWQQTRKHIIVRDMIGSDPCDLACATNPIGPHCSIYIHHIVPITMHDLEVGSDKLLDPDNLITTTFQTHNAIHYGDEKFLLRTVTERSKNDTCPWRR